LASRVLVRLAEFEARDFATLEKMATRVPWHLVLEAGAAVRLRVTCRKSRLYHSDAVAERVARGITNSIPGSQALGRAKDDEDDDDGNTQLIVVRFDHDRCTISADSSGALLHRRGWRQAIAKAPLRETLAAAMLAACDWNGEVPLVDPFCGSGTIGIEAALRCSPETALAQCSS
jgi:putative N6-adenine-specific DNA methylase